MSDDPFGNWFNFSAFTSLSDYTSSEKVITVVLLFLFVLIHALFVMTEAALPEINEAYIKKLAQQGNKKAVKLLELLNSPRKSLSAVKLCITLCVCFASVFTATLTAPYLNNAVYSVLHADENVIFAITVLILTVLLVFVFWVFGELIPKRISVQRADSVALRFSGFVSAAKTLFKPFIMLADAITSGILRIFGFDPNAVQNAATEEEILMMMDESEESGLIQESAKDMIENIFDFDDITIGEIMTHRTEMVAVEDTAGIEEIVAAAVKSGYSRLPVYHEDLDNIVGVICVKDLLKYVCAATPEKVCAHNILRRVVFAPKTKPCSELFNEMTEKKMQLAIVVDEYGGTEGLITLEDLLEIIVGSIQDEYDNEEEEITKVSDNVFTVDGSMSVDDLAEMLDVTLPETDSETVAGLFMEYLGRIPENEEHPTVNINGIKLTAQNVTDRHIDKILVVLPSAVTA